MENHKDKTSLRKTRFWIRESITRRKGITTLQRPPEGGTFNQICQVDVIFKMLIFPKNNESRMLKRNKNIFLIFWARQGLTLVLRILMKMRNHGYVVL